MSYLCILLLCCASYPVIIQCGIARFLCACALCMYSTFPCAKFRFCRTLCCWASPWRKIAYSIGHSLTHSPSLFDMPGTKVYRFGITSIGLSQSWSRFLGSQPTGDSHKAGGRLPLLSTRPAVTFPAKEITPWPVPNYTAWWQAHYPMVPSQESNPWPVNSKSVVLPIAPPRHPIISVLFLITTTMEDNFS